MPYAPLYSITDNEDAPADLNPVAGNNGLVAGRLAVHLGAMRAVQVANTQNPVPLIHLGMPARDVQVCVQGDGRVRPAPDHGREPVEDILLPQMRSLEDNQAVGSG